MLHFEIHKTIIIQIFHIKKSKTLRIFLRNTNIEIHSGNSSYLCKSYAISNSNFQRFMRIIIEFVCTFQN